MLQVSRIFINPRIFVDCTNLFPYLDFVVFRLFLIQQQVPCINRLSFDIAAIRRAWNFSSLLFSHAGVCWRIPIITLSKGAYPPKKHIHKNNIFVFLFPISVKIPVCFSMFFIVTRNKNISCL